MQLHPSALNKLNYKGRWEFCLNKSDTLSLPRLKSQKKKKNTKPKPNQPPNPDNASILVPADLMSRTSDDGWKYSSWSIISCKPSFAKPRTVVTYKGGGFIVIAHSASQFWLQNSNLEGSRWKRIGQKQLSVIQRANYCKKNNFGKE